MNHCAISGNLARDPELRFTPSGTAVANFAVANNRKWKDQNGEAKEEVTFVECAAFGTTAETISKWFKKGLPILVEGRIKQETWEDRQTQKKRSKIVLVVERFDFMGGRKDEAANGEPAAKPTREKAKEPPGELPPGTPEDDDVPF